MFAGFFVVIGDFYTSCTSRGGVSLSYFHGLRPDYIRRALLAAVTVTASGGAFADSVVLKSTDGSVNLEGELISFSDNDYVIQTALGDMRISAENVSCTGEGCPVFGTIEADIEIGGSDTVAEGLMPLLLEGFATQSGAESKVESARNEGEFATTLIGQDGFGEKIGTFLVRSGSSDDAFSGLLDKSLQFGLSARRITPDEARRLAADGAGNMVDSSQEHILAIDSLNVIVNPANPVSAISIANLAGIYSGQITNWSVLGGPDLAIQPVTLRDRASREVFTAGIFGDGASPTLFSSFEAEDNVAAANYVGANQGALAFVGFAFKRGQKAVSLISECGIGTTPDAFSVKTEEYSLFRRLYMYNRADTDSPLVQDLIDYAYSDASTSVILQSGFIDLSVERITQGANGPRAMRIRNSGADAFENQIISDMVFRMDQNDRLSSTFRFRTGSSRLDPRGQLDLKRLATYLAELPSGTEVTFVGFADSVGAFEPNIALSKARAAAVQQALSAQAGDTLRNIKFNVLGFGEVAPSACNNNDSGRAINRRVETWVKQP